MDRSPSRCASSHSAAQIPHLYNPKGSLPYSQELTAGPFADPDESCPHVPTLCLRDPF